MTKSNRPPESVHCAVIRATVDPEITCQVYALVESPRVRALLTGLGLGENSTAESWYSLVLDCRFFGVEFEGYTAELIGVQVSAQNITDLAPCRVFKYGDAFSDSSPLLLWRQRVFYRAENIWMPSEQKTLSPEYPQVPFLELLWNPIPENRNLRIVLHSPINTAKSTERALIKTGKQIIRRIIEDKTLGSKLLIDDDEAIDKAIRAMAEQQKGKPRIIKFRKSAFCSALPSPYHMTRQNIYYHIPQHDPKWQQIESTYYDLCEQLRGKSQKASKSSKTSKQSKTSNAKKL